MGFVIKKITVHSDPTKVRSSEDHYNMIREKWDVRSLLEVFYFICTIFILKRLKQLSNTHYIVYKNFLFIHLFSGHPLYF